MMNQFSVATFAAALITFTAMPDPGVAGQKVRTLRPNGQPIVSRLLPDDEVVIVESLMPDPMPPPGDYKPTRESELRGLARWDELAVIHQARPESFFVMNGMWLNTRVTARVIQTLRTGRLGLAPGGPIEFEHDGGELDVNGVTVRSAVGITFDNSKRYLVAMRPDRQKWETVVMFELDDAGRLQVSRRRSGLAPDSALHGVSLAEVAEALSKTAQ